MASAEESSQLLRLTVPTRDTPAGLRLALLDTSHSHGSTYFEKCPGNGPHAPLMWTELRSIIDIKLMIIFIHTFLLENL